MRIFFSTVLLAAFFLGTFITESLICLLNEKLKGLPLISVLSRNVALAISQSKIDVHLRLLPFSTVPWSLLSLPNFLISPSISMIPGDNTISPPTDPFFFPFPGSSSGDYVWRSFALRSFFSQIFSSLLLWHYSTCLHCITLLLKAK